MNAEQFAEYLSKLLGRPISTDEPIRLSSAQLGAARAWLRRNAAEDPDAAARLGAGFSIRDVVSGETVRPAPPPTVAAVAANAPLGEVSAEGVGIDIEFVSNLEDADDYRVHPFYRDNFTTAEIVHCLKSADPKTSFAGLWAAKEAILKASGADVAPEAFSKIEIEHDAAGRPRSKYGRLSISHSGNIAVAICVAASPDRKHADAREGAPPASRPAPLAAETPEPKRPGSRFREAGLRLSLALNIVCLAVIAYAFLNHP